MLHYEVARDGWTEVGNANEGEYVVYDSEVIKETLRHMRFIDKLSVKKIMRACLLLHDTLHFANEPEGSIERHIQKNMSSPDWMFKF